MSNTAVSAALSGCSLTYTRFLRDTPAPGGGNSGRQGFGAELWAPLPPLNTYEVPGTQGCGCNRRAVGFDRSAPARQSPRGWLLPARDGGLATGSERGWGPRLGPAQHQDLDWDCRSSAPLQGPGLGPAQHWDHGRLRTGTWTRRLLGHGTRIRIGPGGSRLGPGLGSRAWDRDQLSTRTLRVSAPAPGAFIPLLTPPAPRTCPPVLTHRYPPPLWPKPLPRLAAAPSVLVASCGHGEGEAAAGPLLATPSPPSLPPRSPRSTPWGPPRGSRPSPRR